MIKYNENAKIFRDLTLLRFILHYFASQAFFSSSRKKFFFNYLFIVKLKKNFYLF